MNEAHTPWGNGKAGLYDKVSEWRWNLSHLRQQRGQGWEAVGWPRRLGGIEEQVDKLGTGKGADLHLSAQTAAVRMDLAMAQ